MSASHHKSKRILLLLGIGAIVLFVWIAWMSRTAFAQVSIDFPTTFAGFSSQDIKVTIANIVRIVLGFIGFIFLLLILYGGFVWMTSAGLADKINRAKRIIVAAVIGLLITLSAFAIASFVVTSLQQATSGGGPGPGPGPGPIPGCPNPGPGLDGIFGTNDDPVKICFVTGSGSQGTNITIRGYNFRSYVSPPAEVTLNGTVLQIISCSGAAQWADQQIVAKIPSAFPPGPATVRVKNQFGNACDDVNPAFCGSKNILAGTGPSIDCMNPTFGPSDGSVTVTLDGTNFGAAPGAVEMEGAVGRFNVNPPASNIAAWSDAQIKFIVPAAGSPEQAITGDVVVIDSSAQRSNGVRFTVTCTANNQCGSNCCASNACQPAAFCAAPPAGGPVISSITPNNGEEGNYVTVTGNNFGTHPPSTLHFKGPDGIDYVDSLASCSTNWTDTQIIMKVPDMPPAGLADPDGNAAVWVENSVGASNQVSFTVNDTVRPGLCSVTPTSGFFGTPFNLSGINFTGTTKDIYFGSGAAKVSADNQSFTSPSDASAKVPNILPTNTTIGVSVDGEDSNFLAFTVQGIGAGDPRINSIDPLNGPSGQYVTIVGANFGSIPGKVYFKNTVGAQFLGDTSFPPICSTDFWRDDRIVIKVPGAAMSTGAYYILVERNDAKTSQDAPVGVNEFTKNTNPLTPGLCRIDPVGGPAGTLVRYDGEGFGSTVGKVFFHDAKEAVYPGLPSPFTWGNNQVLNAQVPPAAVDGGTYVKSSAAVNSNKLPFKVGSCTSNAQCGGTNICCSGLCRLGPSCTGANYSENNWRFTSGQYPFDLVDSLACSADIQSPTPYPYEQTGAYSSTDPQKNAPVNSAIAARFTRALKFETVIGPDNLTGTADDGAKVFQCNTGAVWGCTTPLEVTNQGTFVPVGSSGWIWQPTSDLEVERWYEVRLDDGTPNSKIFAQDGSRYKGSDFLGPAGSLDRFRWHFRTRTIDQKRCEVADVKLSPLTVTAPVGGTSGTMTALPVSAQCYICGGGYTYDNWTINPNAPPYANLVPQNPLPAANNLMRFEGVNITPVGSPSDVTVQLTNPPSGGPITSSVPAKLSVEYIPPRVVGYSPTNQCTKVCTNALPFAEFNVGLIDPPSLSAVKLYECATQACTSLTPVALAAGSPSFATVTNPNDRIDVRPAAALKKGVWHRVVVGNSVTNTQNQKMDPAGLNYDANGDTVLDSFSWTFQTSFETCTPDAVRVLPDSAVVNTIGSTLDYSVTASTASTDPSCGTIALNPFGFDWGWSSSNSLVASVTNLPTPPRAPGVKGLPQQQATALSGSGGLPIQIQASLLSGGVPILSDTGDLLVNDLRDPLKLIGHRPDNPPGGTPPEPPTSGCFLGGLPTACPLMCTNVLASAIFSTSIDINSLKVVAPSDPIAYYSFDDGTAKDVSGNGNNGFFQEDAQPTISNTDLPSLGRGVRFDGIDPPLAAPWPGSGDAVRVNDPSAKLAPPTDITVVAWVKTFSLDDPAINENKGIISKRYGSWGGFWLGGTGGQPERLNKVWGRIHQGSTGIRVDLPAVGPLQLNTWHHVALTANSATQQARLYFDGVPGPVVAYDGTLCSTLWSNIACKDGQSFAPGTDPLLIGQQYQDPGVFDGEIDDVRIFDRALSATEINQVRLASLKQPLPPGNFYVAEFQGGVVGRTVPGTIEVVNYTDTKGVCSIATSKPCTSNAECTAAEGVCNKKRGRINFYPALSGPYFPPSDAAAYYSFNDGTAKDQTGAGNDGTPSSAVNPAPSPSNTQIPKLQIGMNFDNPDVVSGGNYISISDIGNKLDAGTTGLTVSFWAQSFNRASDFVGAQAVIPLSKGATNAGCFGPQNSGYEIRQYLDKYSFLVRNCPASPGTSLEGSSPKFDTIDQKWHHIVAVLSRNPDQMVMYADGKPSGGAGTNFFGASIDTAENLYFGGRKGTHNFNGNLDDIRIYKRALTGSEVASMHKAALGESRVTGLYDPDQAYQVRVCQENTCTTNPVKSTQGVPYTTPVTYGFKSGQQICQISFVEITPNPAQFNDRQQECVGTLSQCVNTTPKTIIAQAKDSTGIDLTGVGYTWRKTIEHGGLYETKLYTLNQSGVGVKIAEAQHKGLDGVDYNEVTASGLSATLNMGTATAQGIMDFGFCENPWFGDASDPTAPHYRDPLYDFKLSYCRGNTQELDKLLPTLPAPHIERTSAGFNVGGDLLKEHVFVVGTTNLGSTSLVDKPPFFTNTPTLQASYRMSDLVSFRLEATDPNSDSFIFVRTDEPGDPLPASASFNPRTGVFNWVIDKLPNNDSTDPDTINDFQVTFTLNPAGDPALGNTRVVTINVVSPTTPTPPSRPTVTFTSPVEGSTISIQYGDKVTFVATSPLPPADTKSFVWDFQDSGLSSYPSVVSPFSAEHVFLQIGQHQVTFRVQDTLGVWSNPAVVNVIVNPKTSLQKDQKQPQPALALLFEEMRARIMGTVLGQALIAAPSEVKGEAQNVGGKVAVRLTWKNNGTYDSIRLYRNDVAGVKATLSGAANSYLDSPISSGVEYIYKICGVVGAQEKCAEFSYVGREPDVDIIVARVYKNINLLSVDQWYKVFAPNPTGNPKRILVDGYDALIDGTTVYVGFASCKDSAITGACGSDVYGNVLVLSYNLGAHPSTVTIFNQIVDNLELNKGLAIRADGNTSDSCSEDGTIICDREHDAICKAKNAGLCTSAKAELRRDYQRLVALHDIVSELDAYAQQNTFCNDGTNSRACNTDADCPSGRQCVGVYPALTAGSYLGGMSTSPWPSWKQTLGKELGRSDMPVDPLNRFGANFYSGTPDSCAAFPGHDPVTCWNERTKEFRCHAGSKVYVYQNKGGNNFKLYAFADGWQWKWATQDPNVIVNDPTYGNICTSAVTAAVCGNGVVETGEVCDGGSRNYCDVNYLDKNWNSDFRVGCKSDCSGWDAPAGASEASCNGFCGDGTKNDPFEQCEPSIALPGTVQCTVGGNPYCSNTCQIACTIGRPYSGTCGNGTVELPEACDEGALNGSAGHCNATCSGYGTFCGDGVLSTLAENSIGCECDDAAAASCTAKYPGSSPVAGQACTKICTGPAHQWTCVANAEECDNVVGLTSYSCPAKTTLYCDASCNRACSTVDTNPSSGKRNNVPVYEHYMAQGDIEDYDYTLLKKADLPYDTKGIVFYVYPPGSGGTVSVYRFINASATVVDHYVSTNAAPRPGYTNLGEVFRAYASSGSPYIVPVYEFKVEKATSDIDYYYSRGKLPRTDNRGNPYAIQNSGNPVFYAWVGPFQETCGNDVIEGNETCEPGTYDTPSAASSSVVQQYACGEILTPNACQTYGGYCGDSTKNAPFEQCDEGTSFKCKSSGAACKSDLDCGAGDSCEGNGATCDNTTKNCSYCTKTCNLGVLARNYCGDGIINCGLDHDCNTADAYQEVCDDGSSNGKPGSCNETCSGQTGAVCGNGSIEGLCSLDTSKSCNPTSPTPCPVGAGSCIGEVCDDGVNNGRWVYVCSNDASKVCTQDSDCATPLPAGTCTGTHAYCSFSCLGRTPAVCGDGVIQQPNANGVNEVCDSGTNNGGPGECNTTCTGLTPAVCGDGRVGAGICSTTARLCQTNADCPAGETCNGGETCDPPAPTSIKSCTDPTNGKQGLRSEQCRNDCQLIASQCHAFGLKIWSDAVDIAYLNGNLMLLKPAGILCSADPDPNGAGYDSPASPPSGNACVSPQVPYQASDAVSDIRPINSAGDPVAKDFEINGKNVLAVKVWPTNPTSNRSFQAVFTSPAARQLFPTLAGQLSSWACSNTTTPGWFQINCPDNTGRCTDATKTPCASDAQCPAGSTCGPDGKSDCDPNVAANSWRRPFSYTSSTNPEDSLCNTVYDNQVGGNAQWIWGPQCDPTPDVVYCRLEYLAAGLPYEAAWSPNYGWVYFSTAGSKVTMDKTSNNLRGAAWNKYLGWLFFDGTPTAVGGVANPFAGQPVKVDPATGKLIGSAWGKNYGRVDLNPKASCDPSIPGNDCTTGFGGRPYKAVTRDPSTWKLSGYAWSEQAGWIDFGPFADSPILIEAF